MEPARLLDFRKGTVESGMPVFDFFYLFVTSLCVDLRRDANNGPHGIF